MGAGVRMWRKKIHNAYMLSYVREDLFAQQCLDSVGVPRIEAHDISTDGAREADRPEGEKKNKKFVPDCSTASTPQMHPYMTPEAMGACYDATIAAFGA